MYCITLNDTHFEIIKKIGYIPVGLGNNIHNTGFCRDFIGENISNKNSYYGEYTFHYWLWKNQIKNLNDDWIGFCQYRKFWSLRRDKKVFDDFNNFSDNLIKNIPREYENFESILGEPLYINQLKISKFLKKDFVNIIKNPSLLYDKNKRNIKFHFDLMHGKGNLEKAIALLDVNEREEFKNFVNTEVSFNPHNMFICRSSKILEKFYNSIFPWLLRCEKIFGFEFKSYGLKRIYGFLAERYVSFWFKKYTRFKTIPIIFKDINDFC